MGYMRPLVTVSSRCQRVAGTADSIRSLLLVTNGSRCHAAGLRRRRRLVTRLDGGGVRLVKRDGSRCWAAPPVACGGVGRRPAAADPGGQLSLSRLLQASVSSHRHRQRAATGSGRAAASAHRQQPLPPVAPAPPARWLW